MWRRSEVRANCRVEFSDKFWQEEAEDDDRMQLGFCVGRELREGALGETDG